MAALRARLAVSGAMGARAKRGGDRWRRLARSVGFAAGIWLAHMGAAATPPAAASREWHTVALGLCEDYPEESRSIERARADLKAAHDAGAQVLRIALGWDAMEPERGRYDWSFWDDFV